LRGREGPSRPSRIIDSPPRSPSSPIACRSPVSFAEYPQASSNSTSRTPPADQDQFFSRRSLLSPASTKNETLKAYLTLFVAYCLDASKQLSRILLWTTTAVLCSAPETLPRPFSFFLDSLLKFVLTEDHVYAEIPSLMTLCPSKTLFCDSSPLWILGRRPLEATPSEIELTHPVERRTNLRYLLLQTTSYDDDS